MKCLHINIRQAVLILLTVLINRSQMADNEVDQFKKDTNNKTSLTTIGGKEKLTPNDSILHCNLDPMVKCENLKLPCIKCELNKNCHYGKELNATCRVESLVKCVGERTFKKSFICRYCYQTENWEHDCIQKATCNSVAPSAYHPTPATYSTNCTVNDHVLCLGHRKFEKNVKCNWTGGYRWSTAIALSITLGGFGADRFYLGHWQEGIGKLFSFGGLGVWTIIDVILISLHYLGPADGSLYI